jgi:hypothetical protein
MLSSASFRIRKVNSIYNGWRYEDVWLVLIEDKASGTQLIQRRRIFRRRQTAKILSWAGVAIGKSFA